MTYFATKRHIYTDMAAQAGIFLLAREDWSFFHIFQHLSLGVSPNCCQGICLFKEGWQLASISGSFALHRKEELGITGVSKIWALTELGFTQVHFKTTNFSPSDT